MLFKRCLYGFLAMAVGVGAVFGANEVETRDGRTVIKVSVYSLPNPAMTDAATMGSLAVLQEFKREFPRIFAERYRKKYEADPKTYGNFDWSKVEIELSQFSGIMVEGVESDLLAIAGGMAPDVLYINFRKSDNYIRNNFLYPLDEYFATLDKEQLDFRVYPTLWPVIKRKGEDGKKHVWAMPYGGALGKVLLYRKDLFDENGLSYPNVNWTWDDMMAAVKKITNPAKDIYGLVLGRGKHESWYWVTFLWSAGGEVMEYNEGRDSWKCVFDTASAVAALDFYTKLSAERWVDSQGKVRRGYSSKDAGLSSAKWERGEIGMMFAYVDERLFSTIDPDLVGMAPVPMGPTGVRGGELNSKMMGLFSGIKSAVVRDAAWEYMRFITSVEAERIRTKVMVEGGLGRFVNPKYLRMFGYSEIERLSPKGWAETFDVAISTGKPEPYGKNSNFAYDMMTLPLQEAEQMALSDSLPEDEKARFEVLEALLKDACRNANEKMIGLITPKERIQRRIAAVVVLTMIVIAFCMVFRRIIRAFTPPKNPYSEKSNGWDLKKYAWAYVLLLPAVLTILVWRYIPLARGSVMAFQDYKLIGKSAFVGVDNFGDLLYSGEWWSAVYNSLRYSALVLGMTFFPPVILAVFLQEIPRGKIIFRTIYYLPAVITGIVTVLLWKMFYAPSEAGMLNSVMLSVPAFGFILLGVVFMVICLMFAARLRFYELHWQTAAFIVLGVLLCYACVSLSFPILSRPGESFEQIIALFPSRIFSVLPEPYKWLSDPDTAMIANVIPMVWAGMGPGCLIYLAALKGIPDDYYEAADIDGATFIDKILFVVFPMMRALIIINFVGAFINSWITSSANIMALTGGGANTEVAGLHIWYTAFTYLKFGPATAMAWMLGFMLIGFTVHQLKILSRVEFKTTGRK